MNNGNPYRAISLAFATMVLIGTVLLMLPIARTGIEPWDGLGYVASAGPRIANGAPFTTALFTAMSASCVTGLIVVDTATYWSSFGQFVIMVLLQIGGLGTMTLASFVAVYVKRKLTVRQRIQAAASVSALTMDDMRSMLGRVLKIAVATQLTGALLLSLRLWFTYDFSVTEALWFGLFHASSAYNNAGFALYTDSLMSFDHDTIFLGIIALLIILGGLGFPVLMELLREGRPKSMNSMIVLPMTGALILLGSIFIALLEWNNPATLGNMSPYYKIVNAIFSSVSPRTAGFNSIDLGHVHPSTWFGTDFLMYIGGAPASTAGGVKVTTILVIGMIAWSQVRGESDVNIGRKRLSQAVQSQVITLAGLSMALIACSTMLMMVLTPFDLNRSLFEVVSAFGTVGLTTGITPHLPVSAQLLIIMLMFIGRLGPITLATSIALKTRPRAFRYPEDRPLIG